MDRRKMLKESLKSLGQSLPRMLGVLGGAGFTHSSLGERQEKEMRVDLGESTTLLTPKKRREAIRRVP
jgi:hypothetical protein